MHLRPSVSRILHASRHRAGASLLIALALNGCQGNEPTSDPVDENTTTTTTSMGATTGATTGVGMETSIKTGDQTGGDECDEGQASAELVPTNLLFVVDKSGSMNCNAPPVDTECLLPTKQDDTQPSKWESTRAALVGLDDDTTANIDERGVLTTLIGAVGVSAGLIAFPVDSRCAILPSGELTTDMAPLDQAQADALSTALQLSPDGETPLAGAAIRGLDALRAQLVTGQLSGDSYLVVMTDGVETCQPDALEDLKLYVTQALDYFNIRTYVIGAPGSAGSRALLSEIAHRGGTASAADCDHGGAVPTEGDCHIDLTESDDFAGDLNAVFSGIATKTQASCDFDVPKDAFVDPSKVNVVFTSGTGEEETFLMDDRDCTNASHGWQYTSDAKEKIVLCGNACQRVRSDVGGQVRVVFRCRDTLVQ